MKLFWKLFLGLGIAMTLTLVGAIFISFHLATLAFDQLNIQNRESTLAEAAAAYERNGARGLAGWLRSNTHVAPGIELMIVDPDGNDLLDRPLPPRFERLLDRRFRPPHNGGPPNLRPPRFAATLETSDGDVYQLIFVRTRMTVLGILSWPATQLAVLVLAVIAAAISALLVARSIATPIVRLQRATRSLAAGALDARVGPPIVRRRDEVGTLARDFDTMAGKLESLVTAKETLLRDVSHELRSPLARLRVALALAQRKSGDAAQADLTRIERESERLDELVGRILTLARLRSEAPAGQTVVDLTALAGAVVADARFEAPALAIELDAAADVSVVGARDELISAIENVLRNAIAYTPEGGSIRVRLASEDGRVMLTVTDQGPGVDPASLGRLFEPFYQADDSRNHERSGFGLGLAIAAGIVERHGGSIVATNASPAGLTIRISLPAASRTSPTD